MYDFFFFCFTYFIILNLREKLSGLNKTASIILSRTFIDRVCLRTYKLIQIKKEKKEKIIVLKIIKLFSSFPYILNVIEREGKLNSIVHNLRTNEKLRCPVFL